MIFELCVEGADNAVAAAQAGADRLELCAALSLGGLTPSPGMLRATLAAVSLPVMAMVRPRGGDFAYSPRELDAMRENCAELLAAGAAGLVFGCTRRGRVDVPALRRLVAAAEGAPVTFHRAFDTLGNTEAGLEALIDCGVARVLTSGGGQNAVSGISRLRRLVDHAAGRIVIMAGGGLRPATIRQVRQETGVTELHFAAPGDGDYTRTDPDLVRATIAACGRSA